MTDSCTTDISGSPLRPTSAERTRLYRERRRKGLRCIWIEIRDTEITELARRGLLPEADRDDPVAISRAIGKWLDQSLR